MTSSFVATTPRLAEARPRTVAPVRSTRQVCRAQSVKSDAHNLNQLISTTPFDGYKFQPIREATVNRAMTSRYFKDMHDYAEADVVITGAGSAGLACAYELTKYPDVKVSLLTVYALSRPLPASSILMHTLVWLHVARIGRCYHDCADGVLTFIFPPLNLLLPSILH